MDIETGILDEVLRADSHPNWMLVWFMILIVGFVLTRVAYPKYWTRYRQSMIFSLEEERLLKEKNINLLQVAVVLNGFGGLSIALFLFISLNSFEAIHWLGGSASDLLLFSSFILALALLKFGSISLLGMFMKSHGVAARINHSWLIYQKNFGFFLLLIALLVNFLPIQLRLYAIVLGFVVLLIMLTMSYLRGFRILLQERISIFYGILYLCTLEILPVLVIVSFVIV